MRRAIKIVACAAALALVAGSSAFAEKWSFGVMADTQWTAKNDTGNNPNTVAVGIINQINSQFINKGVKFVVQVGDLTDNGSIDGLQTRLDANNALSAAGINFYALRGNHESSSAAQTFFQNNYVPKSTSDTKVSVNPYDSTSYSITYNNTKLVLLDITAAGNTSALDADTAWMNNELKSADHTDAFVLSHKNLLGQNHKDNLFGDNNDANLAEQNAFIGCLASNNVPLYISGHDHMHNRSIITSPDGTSSVQQLICASDSYKFYTPQDPFSIRNSQISQELYTVGYYIFTVDGNKINVDFYSSPNGVGSGDLTATPTLNFALRESWGYDFAPVPEPSGILALLSGTVGLGGLAIRARKS